MTSPTPHQIAASTLDPSTPWWPDAALIAATVLIGLVAGVFALYSHTIMPGLARTDDRTFVGAFQAIDRSIINPWFMTSVFGALLLTGVAVFGQLGAASRTTVAWLIGAFVLYLGAIVITLAVNVPLNDAVKAAGDPDTLTNLAQVRADFDEGRWVAWNHVRTVATLASFVTLVTTLATTHRR